MAGFEIEINVTEIFKLPHCKPATVSDFICSENISVVKVALPASCYNLNFDKNLFDSWWVLQKVFHTVFH